MSRSAAFKSVNEHELTVSLDLCLVSHFIGHFLIAVFIVDLACYIRPLWPVFA